MKLISSFSERFKKALEIRNIKPSKFSEMVDINKSTISQYLSGEYEPKRNRIDLFAKKLEVDEAWLIGYDVPMERRKNLTVGNEFKDPIFPEGTSQMFRVDTRGLTPEIAKEFMEELEEYSKFLLSKFKKK